jgi:dTDP-4-amino-4,6-dideoxygalactose transaminase
MRKRIIPLNDLKREYSFLKNKITAQIKDCFITQRWILGEKVKEFEKEVSKYLNTKYTIGVASGTDALLLSLRALAIKLKKKEFFDKKDEIITTPLTFIATSEAIIRSGATPVFVDIDPDTFNIDYKKVKRAINKNTVGIVVVHLYGLPCDMSNILDIAKENDLFVIEDTAQAFGSKYHNKKAGSLATTAAFSFFPSKNLGAWGDAGAISTNDYKLAELIKILRNHGQRKQYVSFHIGYNSRLDSFQAAVLLAKLKYIDKFNKLRRKIAFFYNDVFKNIKEITPPYEPEGFFHVYHLYTIKVASCKRAQFIEYLNKRGIQTRIYYPFPLYKMKAFKKAKLRGEIKNTEKVIKEIVTIPLFPFMKEEEVHYVADRVSCFFKKKGGFL